MARPARQIIDRRPPRQLLAEELELTRLQDAGAAGQSAGPAGIGPEPALHHLPGGELITGLQHPSFTTVEHLFRVLPEDSWYDINLTPSRPNQFEMGSFVVPDGQTFLVTDYMFAALRQSGQDPGDFVVAAPYRFSGYLGFDIKVNRTRLSNLFYQLDPAPVQFSRQSFEPQNTVGPDARVTQAQFNRAQANSFGSTAGAGTSLLPPRPQVQGARGMPFTIVAGPGAPVTLSCVIFNRVMVPLAGLQASVAGYLAPATLLSSLLNRTRPR